MTKLELGKNIERERAEHGWLHGIEEIHHDELIFSDIKIVELAQREIHFVWF